MGLYDLSGLLVVGISSRALFELADEDKVFNTKGLQSFIDCQREREDQVLRPGAAFALVKGLLELNSESDRPKVEVILMSKNHPDVSLRVFNSIDAHGLRMTRAALTGGAPLGPYLAAFKVGLFLSQSAGDVQSAANQGVAAGLIYSPPPELQAAPGQIKIAFDGDCVIFSNEAQKIYEENGIEAFCQYERANARKELPDGPFAKVLRFLCEAQSPDPATSRVRIALVTDRNMPAHERVIRTLRAWNVRIDEAFFLGGIPKTDVLKAFGANMFFDDKKEYCDLAAEKVPTSLVLQPTIPANAEVLIRLARSNDVKPEQRFLLICKTHLKRDFPSSEDDLKEWYRLNIRDWPEASQSSFLDEFEQSVAATPSGSARRAANSGEDTSTNRLFGFLDNLALKYQPTSEDPR